MFKKIPHNVGDLFFPPWVNVPGKQFSFKLFGAIFKFIIQFLYQIHKQQRQKVGA